MNLESSTALIADTVWLQNPNRLDRSPGLWGILGEKPGMKNLVAHFDVPTADHLEDQ